MGKQGFGVTLSSATPPAPAVGSSPFLYPYTPLAGPAVPVALAPALLEGGEGASVDGGALQAPGLVQPQWG